MPFSQGGVFSVLGSPPLSSVLPPSPLLLAQFLCFFLLLAWSLVNSWWLNAIGGLVEKWKMGNELSGLGGDSSGAGDNAFLASLTNGLGLVIMTSWCG